MIRCMVEEKMYYAWIEGHGNISKTKRKEDNLNNTCINAVLFNYHHFTIQRYNYKVLEIFKKSSLGGNEITQWKLVKNSSRAVAYFLRFGTKYHTST